jgi:hypothetical protein
MRIASKSAITFAISNGLERNKVFLRFRGSGQGAVASCQFVFRGAENNALAKLFLEKYLVPL